MGCDIHSHAERKNVRGEWEKIDGLEPFDMRNYSVFAFLAGVRNYSAIEPIAQPRGVPEDASQKVAEDYKDWDSDAHSASWLSVKELEDFDYGTPCEDRRATRQIAPHGFYGAFTVDPGEGVQTTVREFLGEGFFEELRQLTESGAERIIFWFDN